MQQQTSAGIIPYHVDSRGNRQFLILLYPHGHWGFPKGHVEEGENLWETALRELREETSLKSVRRQSDFEYSFDYKFQQNGQLIDKTVHFFAGEITEDEPEVSLSHEHEDYDWFNQNDALERLTYDNEIDMLQQFLSLKS
ncbi:MAG: bis(5'-nucleosyl)-tetraphosphatase [bacterium]